MTAREVDRDLGLERLAVRAFGEQLHAEVAGPRDRDGGVGGRDERLRRHDVGDHGRAADPGPLDDRHLRAELGRGERRFVAAGSAADDRDALGALEAQRHALILPARRAARTSPTTSGRGRPRAVWPRERARS